MGALERGEEAVSDIDSVACFLTTLPWLGCLARPLGKMIRSVLIVVKVVVRVGGESQNCLKSRGGPIGERGREGGNGRKRGRA